MAKNISEQDIRKAVAEVRVKDVTVKGDKVVATIAFPVPNIPIKDTIVNSVKESIAKLGAECEIKEMVMNQQEREAFLDKEQKNWKGNM